MPFKLIGKNDSHKINTMRKVLILSVLSLCLLGCGTAKQTSIVKYATPTDEEVQVIGVGQSVPTGAVLLGSVSIGDGGFTTKCTYGDVIRDATTQAQAMGGNILYIKKHKEPNLWSTCHRLKCEVYKK